MAKYRMPSSTVENYLKQLYLEQQLTDESRVPTGRLASALAVTPGTATSMVKTLADSGLVDYESRGGVVLTSSGLRLALHVLRRHRLVELFLVRVVGLNWSEVHEEAEQLEHAVSDKVLEKIDTLLGYPSVDPHGDPIPTAKGKLTPAQLVSLTHCDQGQRVRVQRVLDQDRRFLQFIERVGLAPGADLVVENRSPDADAVTVQPDAQPSVTIGTAAAEKILVQRC